MRVVAYLLKVDGDQLTVQESNGQSLTSENVDDLFDFIMDDYMEKPDKIFVTWDLADFAAPLFRKLGKACCEQLASTWHKTKLHQPYTVFFRYRTESGGVLGIDKGVHDQTVSIYSLSQFFPKETPEPQSAKEVKMYGDELLKAMGEAGIVPNKLTSPIASYLSACPLPLSSGEITPTEVMAGEYAKECTSKEWRDCFKVGWWQEGESYDYDIVNAYSSVAQYLRDTRSADYIYSRDYVPDACWGFLKGRVTINDDVLVSPIVKVMEDGSLGTPVGSWDTYLTLWEARFINEWEIGHFDLEDGWFVQFTNNSRPLADIMVGLYNDRVKAENPMLSRYLKGVANGIVGKFLETHDDGSVGPYYNPIWHAAVTSVVRLKVAKFIYENNVQRSVVAVNTDGCLLEQKVSVPDNPTLGEWRYSGSKPVLVLSSGYIFSADKQPHGVNYDMLMDKIAECPDACAYRSSMQRPTTLQEAVEYGDITQVGEMNAYASMINLPEIAESQTREFDSFPQTGGTLIGAKYSSVPFKVTEASKVQQKE